MKIFVYLFLSLFFSFLSFADQGITEDQILIGMHTDLSGPASMIGKQSVDGVNMRIDEFNQAGGVHGRTIKFIVEDHQYTVPRAVQAANKLLRKDKIGFMLGSLGTPMNNAVTVSYTHLTLPTS